MTRKTVLLVDDHADILEHLSMTLQFAGFQVERAQSGQEALHTLGTQCIDIIVSDIAMSGMNGYQLYQHVRGRAEWVFIPFIFLTARNLDSDIRYGKELGIDSYMVKPIQPDDILATVRGCLKRAEQVQQRVQQPAILAQTPLQFDAITLDASQHRVMVSGKTVHLPAREFACLQRLMESPEQVVTTQELIFATHGMTMDEEEAVLLLRPIVRSIRRRLGFEVGDHGCIENVRGIGYRLNREILS